MQDSSISVLVSTERIISSAKAGPRYIKSKVLQYSVCDQYQKTLIRSSEDRLKAATLKGGNFNQKGTFKTQGFSFILRNIFFPIQLPVIVYPIFFPVFPVQFNLCTYISPSSSVADSQPVCLGISNTRLYLACSRTDSSSLPKLELRVSTINHQHFLQKPSHKDIFRHNK